MTNFTYAWLNATSTQGLIIQLNNYSRGWFGIMLSFAIFVMATLTLRREDFVRDTLPIASFIAMVFSSFMWMLGIIDIWVMMIYVGLLVVSIFASRVRS